MSFYKVFAAITLFFVVVFGILTFKMPELLHVHAWYALLYCAGLSLLSHFILSKGIGKDDFYNYSMSATGLRLFASAFGLIAYFYIFKEDKVLFAITFFAIYFIYQAVEIRFLLAQLRQNP